MSAAAVRVRRWTGVGWTPALVLYAVLSLLLFGLPIAAHPGRDLIAQDQTDSSLFIWLFAWWPHAVLHGQNPLVTHFMFSPEGFNLQWTTPMPLVAALLSPVTLLGGPELTYNLVQLAAPALSGFTMFLLCRELTGRALPALLGGFLYGFSPYMLAHLTGGPFLALVPLLPVIVLLFLRRMRGTISNRRYVPAMTVTLAAQYLISTEVLLTAALFAVLWLAGSLWLFPGRRRALLEAVRATVPAAGLAALLVSPFWLTFFLGRHYPPTGTFFSADLRSLVEPPRFLLFGGHPSFLGSGESYLGIPLLVLLAVFAWEGRRHRVTWLLTLGIALALVLCLGRTLQVGGSDTSVPLPWRALGALPVLRYAIPIRLALFAFLPVAVAAARWTSRGGWWRWGLSALAVLSILPSAGGHEWHVSASDPPFFTTGAYRAYLRPADRVLAVPAIGPSERWQADTGFRFRLVTGYAGAYPPSLAHLPIWNTLLTGQAGPRSAAQLRAFVLARGVTAIVVDAQQPGPWRSLFGTLDARPQAIGGVVLYRLRNFSRSSGRSTT